MCQNVQIRAVERAELAAQRGEIGIRLAGTGEYAREERVFRGGFGTEGNVQICREFHGFKTAVLDAVEEHAVRNLRSFDGTHSINS